MVEGEQLFKIVQECADSAVENSRNKFDIHLDFSLESVEEVEKILSKYHDELPKSWLWRIRKRNPSIKDIWSIAHYYGAYLGEVFRRRWGGEWSMQSAISPEPIPTLKIQGGEIFPMARAYKRIMNGPEDNVWHYLLVLKENFEKTSPVA